MAYHFYLAVRGPQGMGHTNTAIALAQPKRKTTPQVYTDKYHNNRMETS
ncbi:hypothetical protein PROFUN_00684 [Planoprotostelium fungivorum]|uniref:Uncharacterized protein n=1 Tax=Planoprotostelium fungivorum TaxID=1890364 RepID=A0A2P6NU27_9EUKA|nr:hypothetical protein PROFUN_00684 [Planoprotostelium fungivorum]